MTASSLAATPGPSGIAFGPLVADTLGTPHRPFRFFARDGLLIAGRDYPAARPTDRRPVVCLPGLTRNARDFEPAIARLVAGTGGSPARRCITFDFRGRGASQYDPDPARYTPLQELDDTLVGLDGLGIDGFTAFGTSRGGIVTMLSAPIAPGRVAAAVLNDIGAVVELAGLLRIKGYVGRPLPQDIEWDDLVAAMVHVNRGEYPRLDTAGFERFARRLFRDVGGRPAMDYDPALSLSLAAIGPDMPMPDLWAAFDAMTCPTLVVRGALSDLLSPQTVAAMVARRPGVEALEIAAEGHAPLFEDDVSLDGLVAFLDRVGA